MLSLYILVFILVVALLYDIISHRIPNYLILFGFIVGVLLQGFILGINGIIVGFIGMLIGFAILLPMYVLGGTGAGDVKLMSVIGLFLGHWQNIFVAGCATLIIGGICGLGLIIIRKDALISLGRYFSMLKCLATTGSMSYVVPSSDETAGKRFPYAIAIVLGTAFALWLILNCSHAYRGILQ